MLRRVAVATWSAEMARSRSYHLIRARHPHNCRPVLVRRHINDRAASARVVDAGCGGLPPPLAGLGSILHLLRLGRPVLLDYRTGIYLNLCRYGWSLQTSPTSRRALGDWRAAIPPVACDLPSARRARSHPHTIRTRPQRLRGLELNAVA